MLDSKWKAVLTSRKFYAMFAGIVFVLLKAYVKDFPLTEEQVTTVVGLLMAYIVGTALEKPAAPKPPAPDQSGATFGELKS